MTLERYEMVTEPRRRPQYPDVPDPADRVRRNYKSDRELAILKAKREYRQNPLYVEGLTLRSWVKASLEREGFSALTRSESESLVA